MIGFGGSLSIAACFYQYQNLLHRMSFQMCRNDVIYTKGKQSKGSPFEHRGRASYGEEAIVLEYETYL